MPVSNPQKTLSSDSMPCGGHNSVTLRFDAAPELSTAPADIVLIMDRSGSIAGPTLAQAKAAANQLIETVSRASGDPGGAAILNGSRLGIVSFSDDASADAALSQDVQTLHAAIDALTASGKTNHAAAFLQASALLEPSAAPRRVIVMFTDGVTTVGDDAAPVAERIRADGVEIFCIGLGVDTGPLLLWASDPEGEHVALADHPDDLRAAFAKTAAGVVRAGALDMSIREELTPDFQLVSIETPSHGTVVQVDDQTLEWTADAVGAAGPETASLRFEIRHLNGVPGDKPVNASLSFTDRQGDVLRFPSPQVHIVCPPVVLTEPCPAPTQFQLESCQDSATATVADASISGLGRIVLVDVLVKNVCPDKDTAVAVVLTELDGQGGEHDRGMKTVMIPAQGGTVCRDVQLRCIHFVVPEPPDADGSVSLCNVRRFSARVLANYADTDFVCCDVQTAAP